MARNLEYSRSYAKARGYPIRERLAKARVRAGCAVCGYNEHASALDFNHFKGEKFTGVTRMVTYSKERILEEVKKCVVLCKNCHGIWTTDPEALMEIYRRHHEQRT